MDIESQKLRYREYIKRLTVGIDIDDRQKLASAYEKLRAANEQFFRNNGKTVGTEQANLLRAALEDVIHEFDTEIGVGRALADVDFANGEEGLGVQAAPGSAASAEPARDLETERPSDEVETRMRGVDAETSSALAGDRPVADAALERGSPDYMPVARPNRVAWLLGGAMLGVLAAAGVAYALVSTGQIGVLRDKEMIARNASFERLYAKDVSAVEPAIAFLRQVEAAIVQRQSTAPGDFAAFGSKFKAIKDFDADLAKRQPAGLPKGSRVILRADEKGYKVLMQSSLCDAARFAYPGLVDPVLAPDGLGCQRFGVWNEGGAKF